MLTSANFSKLDTLNARNGVSLKDCDGLKIEVKALGVDKKTDKQGNEYEVGMVVAPDSTVYTTISLGSIEIIKEAIDILDELSDGRMFFYITVRPTRTGDRTFIAIRIAIE